MITDTQLNMIRFELSYISKQEIERIGIKRVINQTLKTYRIDRTRKNINSIKILIECKN